ncbi:MAG: M48 family metalloprotease [Actinomycetota bacterium]|nr:M48 family metalloprotease [Actinomycetota bacterium]
MSFVLRKSLPSLGGLVGLLLAVGFAFTFAVGAPLWFPMAFAIVVVAIQYLVNPWLIQWLVPATVIDHAGGRYLTDHPVGAMVVRRCAEAGVPLVKLGIVDDGTPNAFTFGRTPRDARLWVTRGLLERLDERELDAVVTHEVGHVRNWDFAVMTVAAVIPMVLYLMYVVSRQSGRTEAKAIALGAYLSYLVSQFVLLSLSRAREYAADHWSCRCTGDGDALASALVKVAYGMGQASTQQREQVAALVAQGKEGKKEANKLQARQRRAQSMRAMGIFEPKTAEAMSTALAAGVDPERVLGAMRWEVVNPWGRTLELMSTHPLVVHRIEALEQSGLPGAPRRWSVLRSLATVSDTDRWAARAGFGRELLVAVAPWAVLVPLVGFGAFTGSVASVGVALIAAGVLLFVKQHMRYPGLFTPVGQVTELLGRLDAGPVAGIGVEVRGRIIGRGLPGYVLSPDLVVQDGSGFVPLLYRQPLPLVAGLFALFRAERYMGQEVTARGWYRRLPGPVVELREVVAADGTRSRSWEWAARYAVSVLLIAAGAVVALYGVAG